MEHLALDFRITLPHSPARATFGDAGQLPREDDLDPGPARFRRSAVSTVLRMSPVPRIHIDRFPHVSGDDDTSAFAEAPITGCHIQRRAERPARYYRRGAPTNTEYITTGSVPRLRHA
jgi:hypothetical protein